MRLCKKLENSESLVDECKYMVDVIPVTQNTATGWHGKQIIRSSVAGCCALWAFGSGRGSGTRLG